MKHRHLVYAPDTAVEALPSAALVDVLERGDLSDWRPVLAAVAVDPNGALAERVMACVDRFPMYGTSPLIRAWIDRHRAADRRVHGSANALRLRELQLRDLRRRAGLTQTQLAARMDMSQSDLSKLERRKDVRLSTLRSYVQALGGGLVVLADLPGGAARIVT